MSDLKFARTTCTLSTGGRTIAIAAGEAWAADDPVVQARPDLFADAPEQVRSSDGRTYSRTEAPVESATAAPGERRSTRSSSRRKGAARKAADKGADKGEG